MADCNDKHFVNDIGKSIEFEVYSCDQTVDPPVETAVDVSTSTDKDITFLKPDGNLLEVTGEFLTDGTDSIIRHKTVDGNLDQAGDWVGQLRVLIPGGTGGQWYTTTIEFEVEEHLLAKV